jgi:lipopolysaccharide export system permease protein
MARTLQTYLLREHIGPFFLAIFTVDLLFLLNIVFRDLGKFLGKGIPFAVIVEFLFLNLAWMLALSVPCAVLTSTIMAFGRLSSDNEITAIKAGGIHLIRLVIPVLILSAILAASLIWFNNNVLPNFNHQARLLGMDITRKKPAINLNPGVIYEDIPDYNILVKKVTDQDSLALVNDVTIYDETEADMLKTIIAERGEIWFDEATGFLNMLLFDGELHEVSIHEPEKFKKLEFAKHGIKIPMAEVLLKRSQSEYRGDREKSAAQLMEVVVANNKRIAERNEKLNNRIQEKLSVYRQGKRGADKLMDNVLAEHQQLRRQIKADLDRIRGLRKSNSINMVEWHKKYSIPVACIVFVLVGAPLGTLVSQRGWAAAAGLSIGFFLLYWIFLIGGEHLGDRQLISPFIAMWSCNIVVGCLGIYLVVRFIK